MPYINARIIPRRNTNLHRKFTFPCGKGHVSSLLGVWDSFYSPAGRWLSNRKRAGVGRRIVLWTRASAAELTACNAGFAAQTSAARKRGRPQSPLVTGSDPQRSIPHVGFFRLGSSEAEADSEGSQSRTSPKHKSPPWKPHRPRHTRRDTFVAGADMAQTARS